jgi:hypothetical protein
MDHVLSRMRGFHNVTAVMGGLKSRFSPMYGDYGINY